MSSQPKGRPDPAIARLDPSHDRASFDCGNQILNRYLSTIATQDLSRGVAVPYVVTLPPVPRIVGYFTLSAASVDIGELPVSIRKRLPAGPVIGVSLLGRLAADVNHQEEGLAALMVATAATMSLVQSPLGCVAIVVGAIDGKAVAFYEHLGFIRIPEGPRRLFLLRESLAKYL